MANPRLHNFATYKHSAGGATNAVIKADAGTLHRIVVGGELSVGASTRVALYDNATTATGTLITELLEVVVLGSSIEFNLDFVNGLAINVDSGAPGSVITIIYS